MAGVLPRDSLGTLLNNKLPRKPVAGLGFRVNYKLPTKPVAHNYNLHSP